MVKFAIEEDLTNYHECGLFKACEEHSNMPKQVMQFHCKQFQKDI